LNVKVVKKSLQGRKIIMDEIEYFVPMATFHEYRFKKEKINQYKKINDASK